MATNYQIKFYKGAYGIGTATSNSQANAGGIYFDETSKQIYVDGVAYGGAITDASFANNKLTITKVGTDPIVLDFSDTASAEATFRVFQHMNNLIGTATEDENLTAEYAGTHYLTSAQNLIAADKALDTAIYDLGTRIDSLNGSATIATVNDNVVTLKVGVTETGGIISNTTGTDITLAEVAVTGAAEDVSYDNTNSCMVATTAQAAIDELKDSITNANITIDTHKGAITSDTNTMVPVAADGGKIGVKTDNVYIGSGANGVTLLHVDTDASSSTGSDLATVNTVTAHISTAIDALDVTGYEQGSVSDDTITIYGIKEEDGKIGSDTTKNLTIALDGAYDADSNKVALESTVKTAIEALDVTTTVQAVTASDTNNVIVLTMNGVEEEDGLIKQGSGIGTVTFAKVAKTGAAADVTLAAANTPYVGSNVDETIVNVDSRIKALEELPKFDTVVCSNAANTPEDVTWGTDSTVTGTLVASNSTMHKIYLVPATGTAVAPNTYAEYITVKNGNNYTWEKVGDTATDLTGYVKTITVNGKQYAVTNSTTDVALDDVITNVVANDADITSGFSGDFVDTKISVQTGTADNGVKISTVTSASGVKVQAMSTADSSNKGLAEASDVKTYIGSRVQDLNVNETPVTGTNVSFKYKETNGMVEIGTLQVDYATVTGGTADNPSITVNEGSKLVTGNDISTLKTYVDNKISTVVAGLDADVTSDDAAVATVEVVETNGVITDVVVTTTSAGVTVGTTDPANLSMTADTATGAVTGADIALIKDYVDAKAASSAAVVDTLSTVAVNSGSQTPIATVGGQAINTAVSFTWEEYN